MSNALGGDTYLWLKVLHLLGVFSWMAGLF